LSILYRSSGAIVPRCTGAPPGCRPYRDPAETIAGPGRHPGRAPTGPPLGRARPRTGPADVGHWPGDRGGVTRPRPRGAAGG